MAIDRVRERWEAGQTALNAWLVLEGGTSAAAVAAAGFDAVTVDLQHGRATEASLAELARAIEAAGAVPFARLRWNDPAEVMRTLDLGVRGLICPMVGTRADAERLVAACRYPPEGVRSYGPIAGAFGVGSDQIAGARERVLVFAMIETAEGFGNLDEIAATPGLDGLYVGPADLSLGLGLTSFADLRDERLLEALDAVVDAAHRHGVAAGVHAPSSERSVEMTERGFSFVTPAVDVDLLADRAARVLSDLRAHLRDRNGRRETSS